MLTNADSSVLLFVHFFPPEPGAAAIRTKYFADTIKSNFSELQVLTPVPNYSLQEDFSEMNNKTVYQNDIKINYLPIVKFKSDSLFKRALSYIIYFFRSLIKGYFIANKCEFIFTSSPPITTAFAAAIIAKIKRKKLILDIRDIWPDIGIQLGIIKNSFLVHLLSLIEKFILKTASRIIVTADGDKNNLIGKHVPENKISIIRNGADTKKFYPINLKEKILYREKYGLPIEKKILVYFGSFNKGMNDISILEIIIRHFKNNDEFYFLLIGDGSEKQILVSNLSSCKNFKSINSLKMEELTHYVQCCDVSLIPRKLIRTDTGGNIPVKCFESWAAGLPVILSSIPGTDIEKIFNKVNYGFFVSPGNADVIINSINSLKYLDLTYEKKLKIYDYIKDNFDRNLLSQKLKDILYEEL